MNKCEKYGDTGEKCYDCPDCIFGQEKYYTDGGVTYSKPEEDNGQFKLEETQAPKTLPQELGTRAGNLGDVSGSATMINNKMNIKIEHKDPELTKSIRGFLEEQQAKGNLTFNMNTKRICDFCKKTLADDEDFITLDNGNDKCEECQRKQ